MATSNVQNVNAALLNASSVKSTQDDLEQKRRDEEKRRYQQSLAKDSIEVVHAKLGVASAATPSKPPVKKQTGHDNIREARDDLKKAFVNGGGKCGKETEQHLETAAVQQLEELQNQIDKLTEQGAPEDQIEKLTAKREALSGALDRYRDAHNLAETSGEAPEVSEVHDASETSPSDTDTNNPKPMSEEEQQLWTQMDGELKLVSVDRSGETDVEQIQKKFMAKIGKEVGQLQANEKDLTHRYNDLQTKWKAATDPKEKADLEKSMKEIKTALVEINQRKLDLQKIVTNFSTTSDALLSYHVSKELGLNAGGEKPAQRRSSVKVASASVKTDSKPQGGGAPARLTAQSAPFNETPEVGVQGPDQQEPHLNTASDHEDSYLTPQQTALRTASTDLTGTSLAISSTISSTSSQQRAQSRKLDTMIKKLLLAAKSGNMEAVVSGMILLSQRSNILATQMGSQTLQAMQLYEKQMSDLSGQMGKMDPKSADYSSKLASFNSQMSIMSSNRQSVTEFFRDVLNMKEQMDELPHSVIGKLGQLGERLAQF